MIKVAKIKCLGGYRVRAAFSDGMAGEYDFSAIVAESGPMVEPLQTRDYFARDFVEMGAPTWPNGFDLDPVNLYLQLRDAGALTRVAAE